MRLSFRDWCIELHSHPSLTAKVELFDAAEKVDLLLCESKSDAKFLFEIKVFGCTGEDSNFSIGVLSQGHGIIPHLFPSPGTDLAWIGFDRRVAAVDLRSRKQVFEHELETVFRSFYHSENHQVVLAVHEIGILAFSMDGRRLWEFGKDIITRTSIGKDSIQLSFMDSPTVELSIRNGKPRQ